MFAYNHFSDTRSRTERRLIVLTHLFQRLKTPDGGALIADGAGSLLEQMARWAGLRLQRYASRDLIEQYGDWVEPWLKPAALAQALVTPEQQNAVLGESGGWLQYHYPIAPGLPSSPTTEMRVRIESLQQALSNSRNLALVVLQDAAPVAALAELTAACLANSRPALVLRLGRVRAERRAQLLHNLQDLGYQLYDELLAPCPPEALSGSELPEECIALHPDRVKVDPDLLQLIESEPANLEATPSRNAKLRQSYTRGADRINQALDAGASTLEIGALAADNWYEVEHDSHETWRWSGPGNTARLLLPCPAAGDYWLGLRFLGMADPGLAPALRLFVNGDLQPFAFDQSLFGQRLELPISVADLHAGLGWIELAIALPRTLRPNPDDPRKLGISMDNISLSWRNTA